MTILTKPSSEKKNDKLVVPLVEDKTSASAPPASDGDPEAQSHNIVILRTRRKRVSATITLCLLITALMVVGIGIIGGFQLYNQYVRAQVQRYRDFRGRASIPYEETKAMMLQDAEDTDHYIQNSLSFFPEDFELDVEEENYEKITVPDFRYGRNGRFIHDFNTNVTGIIDLTGHRCFVMPLNRDKVLPPKSLFDLIHKMWEGYYKVDTQHVRESMRVVTPPISNMKSVGNYIAKECEGKPVYKLEKYVGGVVKRSADQREASFAQFAGKGLVEFDIVNMEEVERYERENSK